MALGHVLLGILAGGPAHGYDLKRAHDSRFPSSKPLAFGQVYATLARLVDTEDVEVAEIHQDGGPERTTYAITQAGEETLRSWLATTEAAGPYAADELVRKTVTALLVGEDAAAFLRQQRASHLDTMRELIASRDDAGDVASRIAIDHTVAHLDADLTWLDDAAARVAAEEAIR